mgnify:CR=1 FL=1
MKKNLVRLFACALAFAMVLSLAACNSDKKDSPSSKAPASSAATSSTADESQPASTPESQASSAAAPAGDKYASIAEFLEDPTVSKQLSEMMDSMGDGMAIDVSADGSKLVYTFKFSEEVDIETTKAAMEEQMNDTSFATTFQGIAASLSDAIEVENPSVVVTYLAMDGTEIYSQEYFAAS